ncbi:periplasmic heavy metal sensor [Ruegeria sp.]|uniref:periplasmic heavy metal sensor n=1 Tax=Ruegeria sp. TaxID=1879320 RepID=UPI002324812A|nr:periplasmic heavy metal sensor [Ruegeria sp.]MDA7963046.1 periplasmic heavy metal sensor [Ruegeria sp.]
MSDTPKPKRRWMPVLLVISLAVNLLIVGVVAGTVLRFRGDDRGRVPPGFGPTLYHALPKEDRKALRGQLSDMRSRGSHRRSEDFSALSAALRTVPFDPVAVELLLAQQAQATADLQTALHQQWLARVTAMSDQERQVYADQLEDTVRRGPHRRGRDH